MRHVIHTDDGPYALGADDIDPDHGDIAVCRCGLSEAFPFCDGSHRVTLDEAPGTVYRYPDGPDGERRVVTGLRTDDSDAANDSDAADDSDADPDEGDRPSADEGGVRRVVTHEATSPVIVEPADLDAAGGTIEVCRCGLSTDEVRCDDSHLVCAAERAGETYRYVSDGEDGQAGTRRTVDGFDDHSAGDGEVRSAGDSEDHSAGDNENHSEDDRE